VDVADTNTTVYGTALNASNPRAVFDWDRRNDRYDKNHGPRWLRIDFQDRRVDVTSYWINCENAAAGYQVKCILEGSNNGAPWDVIDDRSSESNSRSDCEIAQFYCNCGFPDQVQYLRISKKRNFRGDDHCLGMAALEFFASYYS
jgi:hypothetical protein